MFGKKTNKADRAQKALEQAVAEDAPPPKMGIPRYVFFALLAVGFLGFELYLALVQPLPWQVENTMHLSLSMAIVFLIKPLSKSAKDRWLWIIDFILIGFSFFIAGYYVYNSDYISYRIVLVDPMRPIDMVASIGLLILLLEAARRAIGWNLVFFVLFFISYVVWGQHIGGPFHYSGMTFPQFFEMLSLTPDGIFGSPLTTMVTPVFYFMIFGAFFAGCGGGAVLIDCGMKLSDKTAGGPAKAAVVSSCLMGMISGSAVANVATTGVMTIPLMKKTGYKPEEAGAVEACASTGGQLMPPIMGISAFIMAELIGIPYAHIAVSAIIPALAYYVAIFMVVHFIAKKRNLQRGAELKVKTAPVVPRLYRLIPVIVTVVMIFAGYGLPSAALYGTVLSIVINLLSKETRMNWKGFLDTLMDGMRQVANIAIPTAICGVMIGIVVRSGAANKLTTIIANVGNSYIMFALIITMIGCLILGMALPATAAYIVSQLLFCPTLISLGVPVFPANMFIFYFGVIAQITPPVCVASYTAAGIAKGNATRTGWNAFTFAITGFLVPYVFVYNPSILLMGVNGAPWSLGSTVYQCIIMVFAEILLAGGITGYCFGMLKPFVRALVAISAIAIIVPERVSTMAGLAVGLVTLICIIIYYKKHPEQKTETVRI